VGRPADLGPAFADLSTLVSPDSRRLAEWAADLELVPNVRAFVYSTAVVTILPEPQELLGVAVVLTLASSTARHLAARRDRKAGPVS
jgi:hypothetical protein